MKTKTCSGCSKPFRQFIRINGKAFNLSRRSYCLDCSPFGEFQKNKKPVIDGKRECLGCKTFKPLSEFALRGKVKHYRSHCKECETARTLDYGRRLKQKAVDYLGGKCQRCGYNKSLRSLVFHHTDPSQKEFSLGKRKCLNWPDTVKELNKCQLLCANCHGEIHDGLIAL